MLREGLCQLLGLAGCGEAQRRAKPLGCEVRGGVSLVSAQVLNVQSLIAIKAPDHLQQPCPSASSWDCNPMYQSGKQAQRGAVTLLAGPSSLVPG